MAANSARPILPPNSYVRFPIVWGARGLFVSLILALATLALVWFLSNNRVTRLEFELASSRMVYDYAKDNEEANESLAGSLRETVIYVLQAALSESNSPEALRALDTLTAAALENDSSVRERKLGHAIETAWAALTIAEANKPLPAYVGHDGRG